MRKEEGVSVSRENVAFVTDECFHARPLGGGREMALQFGTFTIFNRFIIKVLNARKGSVSLSVCTFTFCLACLYNKGLRSLLRSCLGIPRILDTKPRGTCFAFRKRPVKTAVFYCLCLNKAISFLFQLHRLITLNIPS